MYSSFYNPAYREYILFLIRVYGYHKYILKRWMRARELHNSATCFYFERKGRKMSWNSSNYIRAAQKKRTWKLRNGRRCARDEICSVGQPECSQKASAVSLSQRVRKILLRARASIDGLRNHVSNKINVVVQMPRVFVIDIRGRVTQVPNKFPLRHFILDVRRP